MTHDEFIAEYHKVSAKVVNFSEKARREGLLSLEEFIDFEKANQRDILEYGMRLVLDGTDQTVINRLLTLIIEQEEDKYTRRLMELKKEAVLSIQSGDNPRIIASKLNAFTDLALTDDPIIQRIEEEAGVPFEDVDERTTQEEELSSNPFNEILKLNDRVIQKIIREVDFQDLAKTLKIADSAVHKIIFRNMSMRALRMLKEDMEYMGPVRLKDVEEAQKKIFSIIYHLADTGEIIIPEGFISLENFNMAIER